MGDSVLENVCPPSLVVLRGTQQFAGDRAIFGDQQSRISVPNRWNATPRIGTMLTRTGQAKRSTCSGPSAIPQRRHALSISWLVACDNFVEKRAQGIKAV